MYIHWAMGPAAGACVVAWISCRHIHSGGGQGRQQAGPVVGSQAAVGALAVGVLSCDCIVSLCVCTAGEASNGGQARSMQVHSWRP